MALIGDVERFTECLVPSTQGNAFFLAKSSNVLFKEMLISVFGNEKSEVDSHQGEKQSSQTLSKALSCHEKCVSVVLKCYVFFSEN